MRKDRFVFSFDIEDFEDLDELAIAIKNVLALTGDTGFLSKLRKEVKEPMTLKRRNVTINIYKEVEDELPF